MMRFGRTAMLLAVGMLWGSIAKAIDSPYAGISDRNVFRLSAPTVAPVIQPTKLISPPKITLTGITTILGRRVVFLTVASVKPGEMAESFMFAEGQTVGDIEVKNIDEKAGVVSVINHGESQLLDFEHNGVGPSDRRTDPAPREPIFPRPALSPANAQNETPLTPEEQVVLIEIQRSKYQQENNPLHAILPRTEMTPETLQN
jgi:hypothetical protein